MKMAQLPYKQCAVGGCPEIVRSGRCEKHSRQQKKQWSADRYNEPFYNTVLWQKVRRAYRKKYPLCEECLKRGITKAAEMVHHITAIRDGGSKTAWSNLKSLCNECHGEEHR